MKKVEQNNTNHGNTALTSADELRLVGYLRAFDINGCPLSKFQTISFTRKLFFPDQLNWDGYGWYGRFKNKYALSHYVSLLIR
jgi:hypothetical protein